MRYLIALLVVTALCGTGCRNILPPECTEFATDTLMVPGMQPGDEWTRTRCIGVWE